MEKGRGTDGRTDGQTEQVLLRVRAHTSIGRHSSDLIYAQLPAHFVLKWNLALFRVSVNDA